MGTEVEVVNGMHARQSKGAVRTSRDAGAYPVCEVKTLMTPDYTVVQVCSSG